jgi:5-oxoprolinase (ATP-hydrolysing)
VQFNLRADTGGNGLFKGGDGLIREIEFLKDGIQVGILSERRVIRPYGSL